jgi:branched-chain amino acid aminotransferase
VKKHSRLATDKDTEIVTYLDESVEDAGPICLKLLSQLQGIQLGKVKDQFGWCAKVTEADGVDIAGAPKDANGSAQTIDQMD